MTIRIAIAGSTSHTVQCAEALLGTADFEIAWILTPEPKPVGRDAKIAPNPLHQFALDHEIPVVLISKKIDEEVKKNVLVANSAAPVDLLLVVDFGYLVPDWLLALPSKAPLNIHPSALPKWRGSSPGQFCLLYGEKNSAVTLMIMDKGLDSGPILKQLPFAVDLSWTQTEYYTFSFELICKELPKLLQEFVDGKLPPQPQPANSPTPIARRLTREDGFVEWEDVFAPSHPSQGGEALATAATQLGWPQTLANASRALNPWPTLWTIIPTAKGPKRMQILDAEARQTADGRTANGQQQLTLKTVKIEGQNAAAWEQVKNGIYKA